MFNLTRKESLIYFKEWKKRCFDLLSEKRGYINISFNPDLGHVESNEEGFQKLREIELKDFSELNIVENSNEKIVNGIRRGLKRRNGHCPCQTEESYDTFCPCKTFIEESHCCCSLYKIDGPDPLSL